MTPASKSIVKGRREAVRHATSKSPTRNHLTPLQESIREAHADIVAFLAGDASRVETSTVIVAKKTLTSRRANKRKKP